MTNELSFAAPFNESEQMCRVRNTVLRLARSNLPITITGEAGTGRRTMATAIAARRAGNGKVVHLSGFDGLGGTRQLDSNCVVLLNHINELSEADQRWLAETLGRSGWLFVGTATNVGVLQDCLREALSVGVVELPPLRDRGQDAVQWCRHFVSEAAQANHVDNAALTPKAEAAILLHRWPANLHEARQRVERAVALCEKPLITSESMGLAVQNLDSAVVPLEEAVTEFRRNYVLQVLERCGGNRSQAARMLKVDVRTIFRVLEAERDIPVQKPSGRS